MQNPVLGRRPSPPVAAVVSLLATLAACAPGRTAPPTGAPVADPHAAVAELQRLTTPAGPRQATFAWSLDEAGSRLRGRGVARFEAPERVRLDLFGARGETYLSAALVGDEFRVPPGVAGSVALPSPALLWGAVGVVRPPTDARLESATQTQSELRLRYAGSGGETFEFVADTSPATPRLVRISRAGRTGVRETLQLSYDAGGQLQSARYRDLDAYRELVLTVESMAEVASFPSTIWSPDGTAR